MSDYIEKAIEALSTELSNSGNETVRLEIIRAIALICTSGPRAAGISVYNEN